MSSKVFLINNPDLAGKVFDAAQLGTIIAKDDLAAIKIHFGEKGNTAYIKPLRVKKLVNKIKTLGGKPFFTDSNTLYKGSRSNAIDHLQTASEHGYDIAGTGAPVIIADGLDGRDQKSVSVNYKHFKEIFLSPLVLEANAILAVTHFKGHEATGFGGALKNIGMGLASRAGKLEIHSDCENCKAKTACDKKRTLSACWVGSPEPVQEKIVEYAAGILSHFDNKAGFITFITDVSPNCDCYPHNDPPIVADIGVLASLDPVAIDQAAADLVNKKAGKDIIKATWPQVNWEIQLIYAEKIGLGSRKYELINI